MNAKTENKIKNVVDDYLNNFLTVDELAEKYNVTRVTIYNYFKLSNINLEEQTYTKHLKIGRDCKNGMSVDELAKKYNMAKCSIYYALRQAGVKPPNQREYPITERQQLVIDMYKSGMMQTEIAQALGLTRQRINAIIKEKMKKE